LTQPTTYTGVDPITRKGRVLKVDRGVIQSDEVCAAHGLPILSPGLIDLQINGYCGHDLNGAMLAASEVEALSDELCTVGVAAYLPTLITASEQSLCQRIAAIKKAQQTLPRSKSMIAGIHVEGPSISLKKGPLGAHPAQHVRRPSIDEFERWQEAAEGLVSMITIAPEVDGAIEYIRHVSRQGVCVSLGHCDASEEDIVRAVDAGAKMSTHLGNGIDSMIPRHPNAIWAQLAEDRLSASLILDGHHLPSSTARSMIRAKGVNRAILISDSVQFAGMAAGRYSSNIGGEVDVSEEGRVSMAGTPYLAGSGTSLLDIVSGFPQFVGMPFFDGLTMATHNPAAMLGRCATLCVGERADFILFDLNDNVGTARVRDIIFDGISVLR
jgi:N-acetylglucosamine-6-phosphate deacetylase